jgi:hypothetical protein
MARKEGGEICDLIFSSFPMTMAVSKKTFPHRQGEQSNMPLFLREIEFVYPRFPRLCMVPHK